MSATAPAALSLQGVSKRLGGMEIICGVDLAVRAGERLALIGPNGAGKTTLFHLISGALAPDQGEVRLGERRIDGLPSFRIARLGLSRSFQLTEVFAGLTVLDNLRCAALWSLGYRHSLLRRLGALRDVEERVRSLLERIGLAHRALARAGQLGHAELRALEIGMTVAGEPRVVLLDEPTAGMSQSQATEFIALIDALTSGRTLLLIEHDMRIVQGLADRVAVLAAGRVLALDRPEAVRADPAVQAAYPMASAGDSSC